ncbi:hypothetical protein OESDEN_09612 [Oesophagostomum dentatum]|uniref:G-protein coupled receptors family 1 profile domain-containing protein n=1 Tax=Oesophagostomum dentatum TaxID=61180 RepID=A0A0B1SZX5_OESDE|nr:hypothetical protein OESDEN_09612 [Oesophagostomum dentatum]
MDASFRDLLFLRLSYYDNYANTSAIHNIICFEYCDHPKADNDNADERSSKPNAIITLSIRPVKSVSASVRSAIMTMVAIVATYLISNSLHLILTVMERSDHPLLRDPDDPLMASTFHTFFSDAVSFVYMFTSAIRLVIYYVCNPKIRADIKECLRNNSAVHL